MRAQDSFPRDSAPNKALLAAAVRVNSGSCETPQYNVYSLSSTSRPRKCDFSENIAMYGPRGALLDAGNDRHVPHCQLPSQRWSGCLQLVPLLQHGATRNPDTLHVLLSQVPRSAYRRTQPCLEQCISLSSTTPQQQLAVL